MKFLLSTALWTGMTLAAAGPLSAADKTLSGVEVDANLSAIEGNNALDYWPTLEDDIAKAIAEKVTVDDEADAPRLAVEINKVAIDGDTVLPDTGEFNELHGTVTTFTGLNDPVTGAVTEPEREPDPDALLGSYALQLTATADESAVPEGWVRIAPSQDDFYNALVDGYATAVVERLEDY